MPPGGGSRRRGCVLVSGNTIAEIVDGGSSLTVDFTRMTTFGDGLGSRLLVGIDGMTTRGYAESGVGSASLGCLSCLANAESSLGCLAGGARSCLADSIGVLASSAGSSGMCLCGISRSAGILANSYSYSAISSEVFPRFLILYYLSYTGPYPFHFIRYSVAIPRPLKKVRLFSRRSILYNLRVGVSPSIKTLSR